MFDVEVAREVGVLAAILFQNIAFWCLHSEANGKNYHDGRYWTYNTNKAFCDLFPYMSSKMIRNSLQKLIASDFIITGNYNDRAYDRTIWYTMSEKGKCIFQKGQMELPQRANGIATEGEPIPDINTDINTDINNNLSYQKDCTRKRFTPPTLEELKAYASEIGFDNFDAEYFLNYYQAAVWKKSNGKPVISWKQTVQTWKKTDGKKSSGTNRQAAPNPALDYYQREYKDMGQVTYMTLDDMPE